MYYSGQGVNQDYKKALVWFTKSAEQGDATSQKNLASMYFNGYGADKNYIKAYKWFLLAGVNGNYSDESIQFLEANMTAEQIAEGRRLANEHIEQKKIEKSNNPSAVHP
jgi:TPR repeat protein